MSQPTAARAGRAASPTNRWKVLIAVSAALTIVIIDVTVLHIAAPSISAGLRPSAVELLWIIDIYALVAAPLIIVASTLGDRFGRKRVLVSGLLVFGLASALAAISPSPEALIGARALQGVGGAMIMPNTMSIVRAVFPNRVERLKAIAIWSAVLAGSAAVGPFVGGLLLEHFSWHAVFLINLPVLALVVPYVIHAVPESRSSDPPPLDLLAVAIAATGVLLLTLAIKDGARNGFLAPLPLGSLLLGVALLSAFARRQLSAPRPVLELRLFADRAFSASVWALMLTTFAFVALELFFAQYLQLVLGLEPFEASVRLLPLMIATFLGSFLAPVVLRRVDNRRAMVGSLTISALSLLPLLALGSGDDYLLLLPAFVLLGLTLDITLVAANDNIFAAVSADDAGQAAAIEDTAYELGGGLGVAVLGSIAGAVYTASLATVPEVPEPVMRRAGISLSEASAAAESLSPGLGEALLTAARKSFVEGMQIGVLVAFALIVVSAATIVIVVGRGKEVEEPAGLQPVPAVHGRPEVRRVD